ncbi:hypothetical protein Y032_0605g574 [Ancylostoma ceylanicum]|uniref:Receptor expression-enhancing protein n=1 Tax=Ancylostoma ceylanicum TaxID=53326 RepID=A0A016WNM3_9BILA|nr:hypothetical protein Y032_0605g574 [Ancylostoma ceylanicum]
MIDRHCRSFLLLVVFAVLSVVEFFSQQIVAIFPVYWLFKSLFLLWLYLPSTLGASKVYHKVIKPVVMKHHTTIDQRVGNLADKARDGKFYYAYLRVYIFRHSVIKPVVMKHHTAIDQRVGNLADKARDALRNAAHEVNNHLD